MGLRDEIKSLIVQEQWKMKDVAAELSKINNRKITPENFTQKLKRETIKYKDIKSVAEIIGYDLKFIRKK